MSAEAYLGVKMGDDKMGDECRRCRNWEENMYWTHFQCVHFFQFLSADFHHQLAIPKKFSNNLKLKLPETIDLKGPSGAIWNVGLTLDGDTLLFKHGWKKFVEDHSLDEDDVLIFKYNGESHFDVLMFDQRSLCEKEASYFVRNCGHKELRERCQTKRNIMDSSDEVALDSSHDDDDDDDDVVGHNSSKKKRRMDDNLVPMSSRRHSRGNGKSRTQKGANRIKSLRRMQNLRNKEPSTCAEGEKVNNGAKQRPISRNLARSVQLVSMRRPITEKEKEKALQMAGFAASTKGSFIVVMRPSHVYRAFQMAIPVAWATKHLRPQTQDVTLRVKENTWQVKFYHRNSGGVVGGGWKNFALENSLEEFDVCLFELASGTNDSVVLDVSIFRVVEDIIPPTILTSPSSRHGKPSKYRRGKLNVDTGA